MSTLTNDPVQHGIDNNPHDDAEKAAQLGAMGGAVVGAAAGSLTGPVGVVVGAVVGGVIGAAASGAAVHAIDEMDNDNNVTGLGDHVDYKHGADLNYGDGANSEAVDTDTTGLGTPAEHEEVSPLDMAGLTPGVDYSTPADNVPDYTHAPDTNPTPGNTGHHVSESTFRHQP